MAIPEFASVEAADDLLASEFGSEVVILDLRDGVYYSLDDVGARIWNLLRQPVTVAAIRDDIVAEFDVEPTRCERDIRVLLDELISRGLVVIKPGP
jgi:predicted RecB family endonuclease